MKKLLISVEKGNGLKKGSRVLYKGVEAIVTKTMPKVGAVVIGFPVAEGEDVRFVKNGRGEVTAILKGYRTKALGFVTVPEGEEK